MKFFPIFIVFCLSYLCTIYIIFSVVNWESGFRKSEQSITCLILEFENFQNDLVETAKNVCENIKCPVIIYSETFIYPPINFSTIQNNCDISVIELERSIRDQYWKDKNILERIRSEFILVLPDSIRTGPEDRDRIFDNLDNLDALLIPIENYENESCRPLLDFDVRRWTLEFRNSSECLFDNPHAVLVKRNSLFKLSFPFLRPFFKSFLIQSQVAQLEIDKSKLLFRKKSLFNDEPRLKIKHDLFEQNRIVALYKKLGIKKILDHRDGSIQWYGCDRQQPRCFGSIVDNVPDYLIKDRWLPPCCLRNLEITGRYVISLLEKSRVRYWLEGGSLLGAARNGQIIPWDYDIDIGIYQEDMKLLPVLDKVHQQQPGFRIQDGQGYVWEKALEGSFIKIHYSETNRIHVDIFPFYPKNGTMTKDYWFEDHPQDMPFPEHFLKPLTRISFIGFNVSSPNNVRDFLELKFGKNSIETPRYPAPSTGSMDIK